MPRYNNVVIGAGSAGLISAYISAALKAKVALIERNKMGGDCLNYGCVPSKAIIRTARFVHDMKRHQELGVASVNYELNFTQVMERVQSKIRAIEPHDSVERYESLGVECFSGRAEIISPNSVRVGEHMLETNNIILAMGASPFIPQIPGLKPHHYLTSETLWDLREQPSEMVVLGAGAIGCEMAQAFSRLGTKITLMESAPRILMKEDEDVSVCLKNKLEQEGVEVLTQESVVSVKDTDTGRISIELSGRQSPLVVDKILLASGRRANLDGFDWSALGVEVDSKAGLIVDRYLRTTQKNIYACGDLIGPYQFTHMAAHQAWYCAVNSLFSPFKKFPVDYRIVPWVTFSDPEIAQVGLNESRAKEAGIAYELTTYDLSDLDRAITDSENFGFVKVLTVPGKDKILGAVIVGHNASEMIGEMVLAIKYGLGLNKILSTIHAYPSYIEANKAVAGSWRRLHAPAWALQILSVFHKWRR